MYRTPTTSGLHPKPGTSSSTPSSPSAPAQDAALTFIRRPDRNRRSLDNMAIYKKQDYGAKTNDELLQEVMKTFEDIPSKVKEYPQMRKDIKTFLEERSDKCLRILFELSKRVTGLETKERTPALALARPPGNEGHMLEKLEEVESQLQTRLNQLEEKMVWCFDQQTALRDDGGSDIIDKIVDKIDEAKAAISQTTQSVLVVGRTQITLDEKLDGIAGDVVTAKETILDVAKGRQPGETLNRSYASVTAARPGHRPALHSMAITLEGNQETADEVLGRVKRAVDARETGLKINKVRKAKNQTIIVGCDTETELDKVKQRIESRGEGLIVHNIKNKNPLVILKDVFLDSDDEELTQAIRIQNKEIFMDLSEEDTYMTIKFKKRTRNPKTAHIIVQVKPIIWRRMVEAGALYLDLQRVRVEDQSPLIQCTKCLAFGHGRKFCTEGADRCSHCGGPHLREKCADYIAGNEPQCCNCSHSKLQRTDHNAFSAECPVRRKWDYLARQTTAYA
nr:uncharacterized protein LOC126054275 [Helicoverpa armigera]